MKAGDYIQWECNGVLVFPQPKRLREFSECGEFVFVDDSVTGIPVREVVKVSLPPKEEFTFFWHGPFSQWYPSNFKVEEIQYSHAEKYMMASKARFFGDHQTLRKIMSSNSPREQKSLGRQVANFDEGRWNMVARAAVYKGNHAKFTQNPDLKEKLLATKGTTLVESSPYDQIWGVGLAESDSRILDRKTWRGKNWLGEVLTNLREDLLKSL